MIGLHIDLGGPVRRIVAGGKTYYFETPAGCGLFVLTAAGEPARRDPVRGSPFWSAVNAWQEQGERVDADGLCIWEPIRPPKLRHLGGGHYVIVSDRDA